MSPVPVSKTQAERNTAADKAAKGKPKEVAPRTIIHPKPAVKMMAGDTPITPDVAKQLLGWQVEPDDAKGDAKFGSDYLLLDHNGKKVRCANNLRNRPLYSGTYSALVQEVLMKRWKLNGEGIIIGQTGLVLNGQHTLIAIVLADQIRLDPKEAAKWKDKWPDTVSIEKLIVYGIDESDATVNTMDTCKPRSFADVVYRSEFFGKLKSGDRRTASRMLDFATRILWLRTGVNLDAYAPRRTHSEALDFIGRHERMLKAVRHIIEEDTDSRISKYVSAGTASGLLMLMASSNSTEEQLDTYKKSRSSNEKMLDWSAWDKAQNFFTFLGQETADLKAVRMALGKLMADDEAGGGSNAEKIAILAKAWNLFKLGKKVTEPDLELEYHTGGDGIRHLLDESTFGGVDLGQKHEAPEPEATPDEVEDRTAAIRAQKQANGEVPAAGFEEAAVTAPAAAKPTKKKPAAKPAAAPAKKPAKKVPAKAAK